MAERFPSDHTPSVGNNDEDMDSGFSSISSTQTNEQTPHARVQTPPRSQTPSPLQTPQTSHTREEHVNSSVEVKSAPGDDNRPQSPTPFYRPEIRPSYDVHIIYDKDHHGDDGPVPLVRLLEEELDRCDITYTDCDRDNLPGISTIQQQSDLILQADFTIIFLSIPPEPGQISCLVSHCVEKALIIKRQQGQINRVIPVFCHMSNDEVMSAIENESCLSQLRFLDHIVATHEDNTWIDRVMAALRGTPTGKLLY